MNYSKRKAAEYLGIEYKLFKQLLRVGRLFPDAGFPFKTKFSKASLDLYKKESKPRK